ncbi:GTPase activating protein [Botrytis cinerea]
MDSRSPHMQIRQQRSQKFNLYPTRPRTSSKASELSVNTSRSRNRPFPFPPKSPTPSTREHYLPINPLAQNPPIPHQRPSTSHHSAPNESPRSLTAPQQKLRRKPSEASRLRQLSNVRSHSSTGRRTPEKVVDNFSRPRQASLRRRNESPSPLIHASTFHVEPSQDEEAINNGSVFSTRDRGFSSSSSQSGQQLPPPAPAPAPSLRPSASIPDYHTFTHFFLWGKDEGMSVDDAIGMYEGGFLDSGVEDNDLEDKLLEIGAEIKPRSVYRQEFFDEDDEFRPMTPDSEGRQSKLEEAMDDSLAPPTLEDSQYSVRGSTEIFHGKAFEAQSAAFTPNLTSSDFSGSKEFDGAGASHEIRDEYIEPHAVVPPPPTTNTSDPARDRYGFKKKTQYVSLEEYEAWSGPYNEYVERRRKKWVLLLKDHSLITDKPIRFPPKSAKVKRFVRKGIPPDWRGEAWFWYAGGPAMVAKHYGVYDSLVKQAAAGAVNETDDEIIERDLNRTFPDNIKFKPDPPPVSEKRTSQPSIKEPETPMLKSLRRVLQAFSIYNPKIGYCQSLNFLAGLLLLFMDEEKSFWMLNIITRVYLPGTHEVNLEGANVDLGVLMTSIKESMPAIWAKIGGELDGTAGDGRLSMRLPPITLCTTAWFMSCFIGTLPIETTLRVWDSFFFEGSKTLFRIALAIFKVGEQEIRAVSDPMEIFQVVQTIPRRLVDANGLMDACFRRRNGFGHISQETIEARRAERRKGYAEERAIANGEVLPKRGGTFFSKKKTKSAEN